MPGRSLSVLPGLVRLKFAGTGWHQGLCESTSELFTGFDRCSICLGGLPGLHAYQMAAIRCPGNQRAAST